MSKKENKVVIHSRYNLPIEKDRSYKYLNEDGSRKPSLTQQNFRDECDIKNIIKKHRLGYAVPVNPHSASYGDYASVSDFMDAQNLIIKAQESFEALPAKVRKRFGNSPMEMLEFLEDKKNRQEAISLGLLPKPSVPKVKTTKDAEPAAHTAGQARQADVKIAKKP